MAEFKDEIFYLCDRKKCEDCSEECKYTTDITHAINFERNGNGWEENIYVKVDYETAQLFDRAIKIAKELKAEKEKKKASDLIANSRGCNQ